MSKSHSVVSNSLHPHGFQPSRVHFPRSSPGKNTGVGRHSPLQEIFPREGSNPDLLHCKWILYYLNYQGSPRILEWVAYPFSGASSQTRNQTRVYCIAGGFFTSWATREAPLSLTLPHLSTGLELMLLPQKETPQFLFWLEEGLCIYISY